MCKSWYCNPFVEKRVPKCENEIAWHISPWQLSVSVGLPVHGVPSLWVRKRDLVPGPLLVEHVPHAPQLDHEPSTKNIIQKRIFTCQSFFKPWQCSVSDDRSKQFSQSWQFSVCVWPPEVGALVVSPRARVRVPIPQLAEQGPQPSQLDHAASS